MRALTPEGDDTARRPADCLPHETSHPAVEKFDLAETAPSDQRHVGETDGGVQMPITKSYKRRVRMMVLCALAALAVATAEAQAAPNISTAATDWTAVSSNTASGTLLATSVSLSGSRVWDTPTSRVDGSWPYFAGPAFSPALPASDVIQISGATGYSYTIRFGAPVTDPILELGSLGSRVTFPSGTLVTRLSGESGFTVSGTSVSGTPTNAIGASGNSDASGTIKLTGTYTTITFTTTPLYTGAEDGILVQLGSPRP